MKNEEGIKKNSILCKSILGLCLFLSLAVGIYIRIFQWLQQRSLFIDEANLARNIYEKSFIELSGSLDYEQYAPPLFTQLTKVTCEIFTYNELSLRVISVFAGIAGLITLAKILKNEKLSLGFIILLMCAFSPILLRYSTELKQYSVDFFVSLLLCYSFFFRKNESALWLNCLLGVICIFTSMPSVFVLAAIGVIQLFSNRHRNKKLIEWFLISAVWFVAFLILYFGSLRANIGSEYLESAHQAYFPGMNLHNNIKIFKEWIGYMLGFKSIHYIFFIVFMTLGIKSLYHKKSKFLAAALLSFSLVIIASVFHYYTMRPRLLVFSFGMLWLIIAFGLEHLFTLNKWLSISLLIFAIFMACFNFESSLFHKELLITDYKEELSILNDSGIDTIHINSGALPSYHYYKTINPSHFPNLPNPQIVSPEEINNNKVKYLLLGPSWPEQELVWRKVLDNFQKDTLCDGNTRLLILEGRN